MRRSSNCAVPSTWSSTRSARGTNPPRVRLSILYICPSLSSPLFLSLSLILVPLSLPLTAESGIVTDGVASMAKTEAEEGEPGPVEHIRVCIFDHCMVVVYASQRVVSPSASVFRSSTPLSKRAGETNSISCLLPVANVL
jgi:hypothetical protein